MIYEIKFAHGESNIFATSEAELVPQSEVIIRSEKGTFTGKLFVVFLMMLILKLIIQLNGKSLMKI